MPAQRRRTKALKIASWNISTIGQRQHELGEMSHRLELDIIALQET